MLFRLAFFLKFLHLYSSSIISKGEKNTIVGWQNSLGKTQKEPHEVMHKGILPTKRSSLFLDWSFYRLIAILSLVFCFLVCFFLSAADKRSQTVLVKEDCCKL